MSRRLLSGKGFYHSPAAPSTTAWDPLNADSTVTLTGSNLIATKASGSGFCGVRAVASASTGKKYWEGVWTACSSPNLSMVGLAIGAWVYASEFLGQNGHGIGWAGNGTLFGASGTADNWAVGNRLCFAADVGAALLWLKNLDGANQWNVSGLADPATGVGGIDISALTPPLFPAVSFDATSDSFTANFGGSAYAGAAPSGFGNW